MNDGRATRKPDTGSRWCDNEARALLRLVRNQIGTPCYAYLLDRIQQRITEIQSVFEGRFKISYAVKANPNAELLRWLRPRIELLDVSSGGELDLAIKCGYSADQISFSGPGKSVEELESAVAGDGVKVIVESPSELDDLETICAERGGSATVLLRVNPQKVPRGFGVNMSGKPCQFGIDEENLRDVLRSLDRFRHVSVTGLHIYAGTQCLDIDAIVENFANYIDIFQTYAPLCPAPLTDVIFGGGIGIPYHDRDKAVDLALIAARVNPMLDGMRRKSGLESVSCALEIGRLLVGEAGYFLTRVLREKHSRGKDIRIMDGGLNHHLAACGHFGSVIPRNYRMFRLPATEDESEAAAGTGQKFELFGPLCTTIDQLGRGVELPPLKVGDVIAIAGSGAYGASASPSKFISHGPPKEAMIETIDGEVRVRDVSGA